MEFLTVALLFTLFLQTRLTDRRQAVLCLAVQSALAGSACFLALPPGGGGAFMLLLCAAGVFLKAFVLPCILLRTLRRFKHGDSGRGKHGHLVTPAAIGLLALSYLLLDRLLPYAGNMRNIMAAALCIVLTGMLLLVLAGNAIIQAVGLLTVANGVYLLFIPAGAVPLLLVLGGLLQLLFTILAVFFLPPYLAATAALVAAEVLPQREE